MVAVFIAVLIFFYYRKGDVYAVLIPWNGVKLIRPEGLKLRVPSCRRYPSLSSLVFPDVFNNLRRISRHKILFTLTNVGTRFYLYVRGHFLRFSSVKRVGRPLRGV